MPGPIILPDDMNCRLVRVFMFISNQMSRKNKHLP